MDRLLPLGWRIIHAPLPAHQSGKTPWPSKTITLDPQYSAATRRCTLAHELIHIERGPSPAPAFDAAEEVAVQKATARRLIDIRALGEALAETDSIGAAAELLEVTPAVLGARLKHLHPAETHYLRKRLEHHVP